MVVTQTRPKDQLHQLADADAIAGVVLLGYVCRHCGCGDGEPCADACYWVELNLCSNCA